MPGDEADRRTPIPLDEFDPDRVAVFDPAPLVRDMHMPDRAVLCFFGEVLEAVGADAPVIGRRRSEDGSIIIRQIEVDGEPVAIAHPGVGAPRAAMVLELMIAAGVTKVVACGGAGSLVPDQPVGRVLVPHAAIRDEGTSFHYLPPGREVAVPDRVVDTLVAVLADAGVPHLTGKAWTTDGLFRETRGRIADRVAEGALLVDMELAAFLAVAEFRGIEFGQYLYAGDDVSVDEWDHRDWRNQTSARRALFDLATRAVRAL